MNFRFHRGLALCATVLVAALSGVSLAAEPLPRSAAEINAGASAGASADAIAERIRAALSSETPAARAQALRAAASDATATAATMDPASGSWRRLQSDRLFALSLAGDHAAAVRAYDEILAAGHSIRLYLMPAAAESLFAQGRRDEGERLLRQAMHEDPTDADPLIRLAYLMADAGRHGEARASLEQWLALAARNPKVPQAERVEVSLLLARLERWNEDFGAAERRLQKLAAAHPDLLSVRVEQAALQRQRGQPREALATLGAPAQGGMPADAREIEAQAWLDLGRTDRAAAVIDPSTPADVQQRLDTARGSRGRVRAAYANSSSPAISSPNGADEFAAGAHADSARLADAWRLGGHVAMRRADFQGRRPETQYAGARLTRHDSGGETTLEVGRTFDDFLERTYGIVDGGYWLTDDWRVAGRLALEDPEGPLQARASGIGIDSLALAATWRPQPHWRLDAGLGSARFDDDNRRQWGSFGGERQLRAGAGRTSSAFASYYAASNSLAGAPYFNPRSASSVELGLVHRFSGPYLSEQRLRPSLASYAQAGYERTLIPLFSYELRLPAGDGWAAWEFAASRPVYDGQRETRLSLAMSYEWGNW